MLTNTFYNDWDRQTLHAPRPSDYRTPFQIDRDRVIHSHAFRRLQAKTQVFLSGEHDFYRTRLTHSIEVAQVGRSICTFLRANAPALSERFFVDPDLVEAVCLAHDLGHPPYGHAGERSLHSLMRASGGFEGNAQTARILCETFYPDSSVARRGMDPSRAFLDGVFKYKALQSELGDPENHFLYDAQSKFRAFVWDSDHAPVPVADLNRFRSLECQIMDWADDTAYSLNDIVDGVNAGFISLDRVELWAASRAFSRPEQAWLDDLLNALRRRKVESIYGRKIGQFITATQLQERSGPLSAQTCRFAFALAIDPAAEAEARFYKTLCHQLIFQSAPLQQIEFKGRMVLARLFEALCDNYTGPHAAGRPLLPPSPQAWVTAATSDPERRRRICDYLADMTDRAAIRTFRRLFEPGFGSLADLM